MTKKDHCVTFSLLKTWLDIKNWRTFCYFKRGGFGYGSESEGEDPVDSKVTLPQNVRGRGNTKSQQSAIRLTEVQYKDLF